MSGLLIRPACSKAEMDDVRVLFRAYGHHLATTAAICIEDLAEEIDSLPDPYVALLLASIHGSPAGCIALKPLARQAEQACELKRLWVSPGFRGRQTGTRLLQAAINHGVGARFTTFYLDTVPAAMPEATHIYEALGFERTDRYNTNPVEGVVFFRLTLPSAPVSIETL